MICIVTVFKIQDPCKQARFSSPTIKYVSAVFLLILTYDCIYTSSYNIKIIKSVDQWLKIALSPNFPFDDPVKIAPAVQTVHEGVHNDRWQISFITTMRLSILQLSCRLIWQCHITQICQHPYGQDLAPCDIWFFPKLKSPLKVRRFVNVMVTQYTTSVNGVSLSTD
jgi:hypothetical protein